MVVIALVLVGGVLVVATDTLRLSDPLDEMAGFAASADLPPQFVSDRVESSGDHFCFLQCAAWEHVTYFSIDVDEDIADICSDAEQTARAWLGAEMWTDGGPFIGEIAECAFGISSTPGHSTWCSRIIVYNALGRSEHSGADAEQRITDGCGG